MHSETFTATPQNGKGEGTFFTTQAWFQKQVKAKLGFTPSPGTLNLKLPQNVKRASILPADAAVSIKPEKGYAAGKCYKAIIADKIEGAIVVPDVPDYPGDVIEFIAPVNVRKQLNLSNDKPVKVTVVIKSIGEREQ